MATQVGVLQNARLKARVVPREHGAWGMLFVPMVSGAVVAGSAASRNYTAFAVFLLAALSLFWMRTPLEAWLGTTAIKAQSTTERLTVAQVTLALAFVSALATGWLFRSGYTRGLLAIGGVAAIAFASQALIKGLGRAGRMPAQIVGAVGLTATAAGAYYVITGRLDATAISLWLANWLFAADQIHYVQLCIHGSRTATLSEKLRMGFGFIAGQLMLVLVLVLATLLGYVSWLVLLAFTPALARGTTWFFRGLKPLQVHKLGFAELRQALLFGALLCIAFLY